MDVKEFVGEMIVELEVNRASILLPPEQYMYAILPSVVRFNITPFNAVNKSLQNITMYPREL